MKCALTSTTSHDVMISKEMRVPSSYNDICRGEPKKVNIGYNNDVNFMSVQNNTLIPNIPEQDIRKGISASGVSETWEVLFLFFSLHNIEPNWLNCHFSWGKYSSTLGGWTGCTGKVWHLMNLIFVQDSYWSSSYITGLSWHKEPAAKGKKYPPMSDELVLYGIRELA